MPTFADAVADLYMTFDADATQDEPSPQEQDEETEKQ
jgi:hypothetical protein